MAKKIILACMAIAAFAAFVLPASASASPRLCETAAGGGEPCTNLVPPVKIVGTNTETWKLVGSLGTISCSTVFMTGTLTTNSGTHIAGDIETADFSGTGAEGKCTSPIGDVKVTTTVGNGTPWCLTAGGELAADKFSTRGNSCTLASRSITFVLDFAQQTCYYNRTAPVEGSFTTDTSGQDAVLSFENAVWTLEKSENTDIFHPCLSEGTLKGAATLETEDGTPLYIK